MALGHQGPVHHAKTRLGSESRHHNQPPKSDFPVLEKKVLISFKMHSVSVTKAAAAGLVAAQGAAAWGALGHATVAYVAQNYLTSDTATW